MTPVFRLCDDLVTRWAALDPVGIGGYLDEPFRAATDTASRQPTIEADLQLFAEAVRESTLPDTALFRDQAPATWDAALRLLVRCLPDDRPSVIVLAFPGQHMPEFERGRGDLVLRRAISCQVIRKPSAATGPEATTPKST
jgi:hypothetical protein